jgi:hypothetical protein
MHIGNFIFVLIGLFPCSLRADPGSGITLKGGVNAATHNKDHRVHRHGLSGGLAGYRRWPPSGGFSLAGQVELLYTPRGTDVIFDGVLHDRIRQHYLDVTLAARPEVRLGSARIYLLLGGGLNLLVHADDENAAGVHRDVTDEQHRIDVALLVGAGVAMQLPHRRVGPFRLGAISLEARHDRGMIDFDTRDLGFRNRSSSLMLGFTLVLAEEARPRADVIGAVMSGSR